MKVSIITVVYNNEKTIADAIESVLAQTYPEIEHIIIDGKSKDNTMAVVDRYKSKLGKVISEKDEGLYDAMNKGIKAATGDIVGILNSDDFFNKADVIATVAEAFKADSTLQATIGDIVFVNSANKIIRHYSAKNWTPKRFVWGYMPPHPSFFVKRELFEQLGYYKMGYRIAADYELLIRFLAVGKIRWKYIPLITTRMRLGGKSTKNLRSNQILNEEILKSCKENGLRSNYLMIYSKYFIKPFEFLNNKKINQ